MNRKDSKNIIKYPASFFKEAVTQKCVKEFGLLMDLKRVFQNSFIKDYTDFNKIKPLLSNYISEKTYFKYIHRLNRLRWLEIKYKTIRLKSYRDYGSVYRYVLATHNYITRMYGQWLKRACEKQKAKIRSEKTINEKRQFKTNGDTITFAVLNFAALITMSCNQLGKKLGKSKTWGYSLKQKLKAMGALSLNNLKEYLGTTTPPPELLLKRKVKFLNGVWYKQWADELNCSMPYDERRGLIDLTDVDNRTHYLYYNDTMGI